jgi:hypothetical protein
MASVTRDRPKGSRPPPSVRTRFVHLGKKLTASLRCLRQKEFSFLHPHWKPGQGWESIVASTYVESGGETLVLGPLAPPAAAVEVWKRLDARQPTAVVVLKPDHVRDVDLFVRRYGARAFGPRLFFREDVPETELEFIEPGSQLPGGIVALYDGRGRNETPLWLPEQCTLIFADALTAPRGELRVWASPAHEQRALPALRAA